MIGELSYRKIMFGAWYVKPTSTRGVGINRGLLAYDFGATPARGRVTFLGFILGPRHSALASQSPCHQVPM